MEKEHMRIRAEISLDAVAENVAMMREKAGPDKKICAVIKADGYGHGALPIARRLEGDGSVWGFAVATADEAHQLRRGGVKSPILILGLSFAEDYPLLLEEDIRPTLCSLEAAKELSRLAAERGPSFVHPVHLSVDTGMSRIGLPCSEEGIKEALAIASLPGIRVEGIFTHFARADETDKVWARKAYERFRSFTDALEDAGCHIPIRHCANSAAILEMPETHLDMVRAGITLYGIYPSDEMIREISPLRSAMRLVSHLTFVKDIPAGTQVSYGGTFTSERPMRIGTVPVGYADGYPRSLSGKGSVLIGGKRCPILGRVCMDQFMVDLSGVDAAPGDEVILMGKSGDEEITVDELGALSGRFPYEFVCLVGRRVPRVYG